MRERARIVVEDVKADPLFGPCREIVAAAGCRAVQSTPLLSRTGELLGVLSTHYDRPYRPPERELRVLDLYARQAADFIERKRHEDALRHSEERYRAVVEQSPDAILVNAGGRVVYANTAAATRLGAPTAADLLDRCPLEFVEPEYHDVMRERVRMVLEEEGQAPRIESRWRRPDGSPVEVEASAGRIVWHGEPAVRVTARDIIERQRAEEALFRSEQQLRAELADTMLLQGISQQLIEQRGCQCALRDDSRRRRRHHAGGPGNDAEP